MSTEMNTITIKKEDKPMIIMYRGNTIDGWLSAYMFFSKYSNNRIVKLWAFDPYNPTTYPSTSYIANYDLYFVNGCIQCERLEKWVNEGNIRICKYFDNHSDALDKVRLINRSNGVMDEFVIEKNENGTTCTSYWDKYISYNINSSTLKLVHNYLYNNDAGYSWVTTMDKIIMWKHLTHEEKAIHELFHSVAVEYNKQNVGKGLKYTRDILKTLFEKKSANNDIILEKHKQNITNKENSIKEILENVDESKTIITLTKEHVDKWQLPIQWIGVNIFVLDTTNVSIDSTLASDIVFNKYNTKDNGCDIDIFINYRKIVSKNNKSYVHYSCRAFKEENNIAKINLLDWKLVKGFPLSAGGKYDVYGVNTPFVS